MNLPPSKISKIFLIYISLSLALISCASNSNRDIGAVSGAVIGGGIGAASGNALGGKVGGLAIGAATGGLIGGLIGREQDVANIDSEGQEQTIQKQQKVFDRQKKEIEDIKRQRYYDQRLRELSDKNRIETEANMKAIEEEARREAESDPINFKNQDKSDAYQEKLTPEVPNQVDRY